MGRPFALLVGAHLFTAMAFVALCAVLVHLTDASIFFVLASFVPLAVLCRYLYVQGRIELTEEFIRRPAFARGMRTLQWDQVGSARSNETSLEFFGKTGMTDIDVSLTAFSNADQLRAFAARQLKRRGKSLDMS